MTWLSEIEQTNKQRRLDLNYTDEMPDEQMARVIREHSKYILYLEGLLNWDKANYTDVIRGNYMSPDAKEIVDDCAAPSST